LANKVIVGIYDAVGGPKTPRKGEDGLPMGQTDAGKYVVARCTRAIAEKNYSYWSRVPWGTPLDGQRGIIKVFLNGKWQPLSKFTPATKKEILDYHEELYGSRIIPNKWVFNDFGHMACYYFEDLNKNLKKDGKEKIKKELIHTTPDREAQTAMDEDFVLDLSDESHGCIHVKPKDIDEMIDKGYLKAGNRLIIHRYNETAPIGPVGIGKSPFEVHFFPGSLKILVKGVWKPV
jgi:hypothetical protein